MPKPGPDKTLCGAQRPNKPKGVTCKQVAGARTDHLGVGRCWRHGGCTESHEKSAQVEQIKQAAMRIAGTTAPYVEPTEVILMSLAASWWNVARYEEMVAELPTHPEDDELTIEHDDKGRPVAVWKHGEPGLYAQTYHQSGLPTGEAKRVILLQMLEDERDRAFKQATEAAKLGIEERRIRIAEAQTRELFNMIGGAMADAELTPEQTEKFRRALAARIRDEPAQLAS